MIKKIFIALLALFSSVSFGQVGSADAAQLLKNLDPASRDAILREYGLTGGDPSLGVQGLVGDGARRRARPDSRGATTTDEAEEARRRESRVAPGSTLIVRVDYVQDKPERLQERGNGLPAVIVPAEKAPAYSDEERLRFDALIASIRSRNPYTIDPTGSLQLPGFPSVLLSGLTEQQATARLVADPLLAKLSVSVTILPLDKTGFARLKLYGHDLFENELTNFDATAAGSVPPGYVLGPGDALLVQLFGAQNRVYRLLVDREGKIAFPEIGPISVVGKTFESANSAIAERVSTQLIGVRASVSMAETRAIQVFVAGDVRAPGSYTISGLSTVLSALYVAGGISERGSLRNVQVKRGGALVGSLDLYDLLLRGDSGGDLPLRSGDVVFVPPIGMTVAVDGSVRRPAIYELKARSSLQSVVALAGGLLAEADESKITVVEFDQNRRRVAAQFGSTDAGYSTKVVGNGAEIFVSRLRPALDAGVIVEGQVFRSGTFAWREGLRLTDVLPSFDELRPGADPHYIVIQRELPDTGRVEILSVDLQQALSNKGGLHDLMLSARDKVIVFDADAPRADLLKPIFTALRRQSTLGEPTEIVSIVGRVRHPGDYPLEREMRVSDLIRAGGRLRDNAFPGKGEITRFVTDGVSRRAELLEVDLAAILAGESSADIEIKPFDVLTIKELPEWARQEFITLSGEVRFPGRYPIRRGETLRSILERAGGLTTLAFPRGAVFTRKDLQERESRQIASLTEELSRQAMARSLQAAQATQNAQNADMVATSQMLLSQLESTKAVGRLVIDLDRVIQGAVGSRADVLVKDGDILKIPSIPQEVTVLGEVRNVTSHLFRSGLDQNDYISLSGGLTSRADKRAVYVIRADGSVVGSSGGWLSSSRSYVIQPGDTVVAPLDIERLPPLPLWQAVTSILYNTAVAITALGSL